MEIPSMRTWVDGETVTPQDLNGQVRDVGNFLLNNRPATRVAQMVNTTAFAHNTWTPVDLDTEEYDRDSAWVSTTPSVLTIQTPGVYLLTGQVCFDTNANGDRLARIYSPSLDKMYGELRVQATTSFASIVSTSAIAYLAEGTTVGMQGYQTSGVTVNSYVATNHFSYISAIWLAG